MNYPSDENAAILCRGLVKFTQLSVPTAVVIVNSYSHNCSYTAKAFGLRTSTTFLGCPSCITVTKECYQIGLLESSLRDVSTLASLFLSEDLFGYIPGIAITTMQPRNSFGRCIR